VGCFDERRDEGEDLCELLGFTAIVVVVWDYEGGDCGSGGEVRNGVREGVGLYIIQPDNLPLLRLRQYLLHDLLHSLLRNLITL